MTLKRLTMVLELEFFEFKHFLILDVTSFVHFPAHAASIVFCPYLGIKLVS